MGEKGAGVVPPPSRWLSAVGIPLFFAILTCAFFVPILSIPSPMGEGDANYFTFRYGVERETIVRYGQIPFWNPYLCGGMPELAHPHSRFLDPAFLVVLCFGEQRGPLVDAAIHYWIGLCGMFLLARALGLRRTGAIFSAVVFVFSSRFAHFLAQGWYPFLAAAWIPWAFLCYLRALREGRWVYPLAGILALFVLRGDLYHFAYTLLLLGVHGGWLFLWRRRFLPLLRLFEGLFGSILLGGVKWVPMLHFVLAHPRPTLPGSVPLDLPRLWVALLDRGILDRLPQPWEYGNYIGWLPFLFGVAALPLAWRGRFRFLVIGLGFFLLAAFGDNAMIFLHIAPGGIGPLHIPLSLDRMIHALPLFGSLRTICRMIVMIGFLLALLGGCFLSFAEERLALRYGGRVVLLAVLLVGFVTWDLLRHDHTILVRAIRTQPFERDRRLPFRQVRGEGSLYGAFLRNMGILDARDPIFPEDAVRAVAQPDPHEGGVIVTEGKGKASIVSFSPNEIEVVVRGRGRGSVVLDMNAAAGWRVEGGERIEVAGRLGARYEKPGRLRFHYRPPGFGIGLLSSLLFLLHAVWRLRPLFAALLRARGRGEGICGGPLRLDLSFGLPGVASAPLILSEPRWRPFPLFLLLLFALLLPWSARRGTSWRTLPRLFDDFGDGAESFWEPHQGRWYVEGGRYRVEGAFGITLAGASTWRDYRVIAKLTNAADGGILVRARGADDAVALIVRPRYGDAYWILREGGEWREPHGRVPLPPAQDLEIEVRVTGERFFARINGETELTFEDETFPEGRIGLYLCCEPGQGWRYVHVEEIHD